LTQLFPYLACVCACWYVTTGSGWRLSGSCRQTSAPLRPTKPL